MFNEDQIKKLVPVIKWPPPPEEDMTTTKEVEIMPGVCPDCGRHIGSCICPLPQSTPEAIECKHSFKRTMTWPDGAESEVCIKCLKTKLKWEDGETGWQDHNYNSLIDWYKEAVMVEKRIQSLNRSGINYGR